MKVKFTCPKFKHGVNPSAIYRMDFDTGHFYYGSSKKIKTRMVLWRTCIKTGNFSNRLIKDVLPAVKKIKFSIVEYVDDSIRLDRETTYIRFCQYDPMCLNRYLDANQTPGIRPLPPHLKKQRKPQVRKPLKGKFIPPPNHVYIGSKPVNKYSLGGELVRSYKSISQAAKENHKNMRSIQDVINGLMKKTGGFIYRYA